MAKTFYECTINEILKVCSGNSCDDCPFVNACIWNLKNTSVFEEFMKDRPRKRKDYMDEHGFNN